MNCKIWTLGILLVGQLSWAGSQTLQFVTTLSSPIASFKEVVAQNTDSPTVIENEAEINLGAPGKNGDIDIKGGAPYEVDNLLMESGTAFVVKKQGSEPTVWFVDGMTIGNGGEVSPDTLSAQEVTFANSGNERTLKGEGNSSSTLTFEEAISVTGGASKLINTSNSKTWEINSPSPTPANTATFATVTCQSQESNAGVCSGSSSMGMLLRY